MGRKFFWNDSNSEWNVFFEKYSGAAAILQFTDGKAAILKVNSKYYAEIGVNSEEKFSVVTPWENVTENGGNSYVKAIREAIETKEEQICETWRDINSRCCGEDKVCIRSFIQLLEQEEETYYLYVRIQNVTEEKKKYLEVSDSETRFRFAAEQINVYAWEYTVATRQMRPCYRCMRDLGLPALLENYPEPAIEMGIFPPDYADMYRDWHKQIEAGAKELEAIIPLTVGRVPFHVRYTTEFDENGKPLKAYGSAALVVEDQEKIAEQQEIVHTLSQHYENVFRVELNRNAGTILKADEKIFKLISKDESEEFSYFETFQKYVKKYVPQDEQETLLEALKPERILRRLEKQSEDSVTFRVVDGEVSHYLQLRLFHLSGKKHVIMALQNVDEAVEQQRKAEANLQKALDDARRANAAKTTYLSHISHDIRTPLNGIIGLLEMDERHADDLEMIEDNRKKIKVAADHLLSLINDVLNLSKIEDNNVVLSHEPFDLCKLEQDVITIAGMRADDAGITLSSSDSVKNITVPNVYGSPLHLRQIILNILGNSIKYNKANGSVRYHSEVVEKTDDVVRYRFEISDTGIGMSEEFLCHIFEPFSQEKQDEKSVYQGTGLGMSIVKALVDKMDGSIEITSKVGEGSCFSIVIPFEIAKDFAVGSESEVEEKPDISGIRILLVEDNKVNMFIGKRLLEDAGANVTCVYHGKEALECFEGNPPDSFDVILMDVMMPVMDGLTATKKIRALEREDAKRIRIIAMTANAFEEDKQTAFEAGMNAYVTKPLNAKELILEIARQRRQP